MYHKLLNIYFWKKKQTTNKPKTWLKTTFLLLNQAVRDRTGADKELQGLQGMCTGPDSGCTRVDKENTGGVRESRGFSYIEGFQC